MQIDEKLPPSQLNEMAYDDLLVAIEASKNSLSLFLVICDNFKLREAIIQRYEAELEPEIRNYQIILPKKDPSLKQAIARTIESDSYLKAGGRGVLTVVGLEQLFSDRYGADRSEQEIFLGYLQWTREGLREFRYPIILWLTQPLLEKISREAKDFWSWRKDVFRFVSETPTLIERPEVAQIPQNLPYLGNVSFVGREAELKALHQQLGTVAISAIAGMGGIGKTELALQYSSRYLDEYPGGICWLRAREDISLQVVVFARRFLGLEPPSDLFVTEQVAWCWRNWMAGEVLIIFDDVQNYADIQALLPPPKSRFNVLLTTRSRFGFGVQEMVIDALSASSALELLRSLVPDGRIDQELDAATQLCKWLGYLPLALQLVGQYLVQKKDLSVAKLWERLQNQRLAAKALLEPDVGMTATLGVGAAFELSWQELNEEAQQLAALLSLFALAGIPWALVQQCLPEADEEALENLRDEQLVNSSLLSYEGKEVYQLHQLLREFFAVKRSQMPTDEEMKRSFCRELCEIDLQISLPLTISAIEQLAPLIPHLKEAATTLEPWLSDSDLIKPFTWIGQFYLGQLAFEEAERWFLHGQAIVTQRLGDDHSSVAVSLNNLAELYYSQGRYGEAEPLFVRSLETRQRQLGDDHPDVAQSLNNLATLYRLQGRYGEAEPLYLLALEIRQRQLGDDHPDVAQSLNNLATLYRLQGRYGEAEPLYLLALEIRQRQLGDDHPDVAQSLNNLATLYRLQGRYGEAEPLYLLALEIRQRQLGDDHPNVAQSLWNLAVLYENQGQVAEVEPLYIEAISIFYQRLGETHPHTQSIVQYFASFLQQVIQANRTDELSDDPMTRSMLQQIQEAES